jgi:hypothetical protein
VGESWGASPSGPVDERRLHPVLKITIPIEIALEAGMAFNRSQTRVAVLVLVAPDSIHAGMAVPEG